MTGLRIAFRTDANNEIGTGHFMRCLTLAEELKKYGFEIKFVSRGMPIHLQQMLQMSNINLCKLTRTSYVDESEKLRHSNWLKTSQIQDAIETEEVLGASKMDWLIVDHYALDYRWEGHLRSTASKILVIDDLADRKHDCDLLVDQNFYVNKKQRYQGKVPAKCQMLLGPEFALLRNEFREKRNFLRVRSGEIKNILISFGGIDSKNFTAPAIKAISKLNWNVVVNVVIGKNHPNLQEIQILCKSFRFECHIQSTKIAELMDQADIAIGAGGISLWERLCIGLPSICIVAAENQKEQLTDLQNKGFVSVLEEKQDLVEVIYQSLIKCKVESTFLTVSEKLTDFVDGFGAIRVRNFLIGGHIEMRLADASDSRNIFLWRNHPRIRAVSSSSNEIFWFDHDVWYQEKCGHINYPILIGEIAGKPVGVVRFEINNTEAEVSIYLIPESDNRGFGQDLLRASERWLSINRPSVTTLRAIVLHKNRPSINLFSNLQYVQCSYADQIEFLKKI
jgi:UDP-2,4-diacetamido-2,4,6-trideoxy-beta-L-altropyranose hydrolase